MCFTFRFRMINKFKKVPFPMRSLLTRSALVLPVFLTVLHAAPAQAAENFTPATGQKLVAACEIDLPRRMTQGKITAEQGKVGCECLVQKMKTSTDTSGFTEAKWLQVADIMTKGPAADTKAYPPEVVMTAGFYFMMMQEPEVAACVKKGMAK